jgi:hypothetical protein
MIDCDKCRERMIEALYGELGEDDKASFNAHLGSCALCAAEFKAMTATLELLDKRERPDPGPAFWDGYWDRLSKRLDKEMSPAPSGRPARERLAAIFNIFPKWAYQLAGGAALVVVGILIGRTVLSRPAPPVRQAQQPPPAFTAPGVQQASAPVLRARNFIDRSKLIILALVNYDPRSQDAYGLDLPRQKQVSRELVNEASGLKSDLKDPAQKRLRELVSDLETIFIQIANLESANDLSAVEFVKQGAESRGIMFKINLAEMEQGGKGDRREPQAKASII